MQEPDGHLLNRFASHRDEAAFGELTARYLGLIYHVALRRTGDRQMAGEVSQNVLCAVVRKAAALARHPDRLPAWLHRATLFESSKAMRSEASHQRRKQLVHPDVIASTGDADPAAWNAAMPLLDLALDRLPEADRRIVLRHYFEGKSFNQIGAEVSRPAATVQKQCRRALDKLARILRGKGVTLSVATLASGLAVQSAKAAPTALLKSAAAKALAGAATYSTTSLTLFMAMKSKATLPIALPSPPKPFGPRSGSCSCRWRGWRSISNACCGGTGCGRVGVTQKPETPRFRSSWSNFGHAGPLNVRTNKQTNACRISPELIPHRQS